MIIYIIRHGETAANKDGCFQGQTDVPLNESGIALARETGRALAGIKFDAAFSSPLCRAYDTAREVLKYSGNNIGIIKDERIKEVNMGDWEKKRFKGEGAQIPADEAALFFKNPFLLKGFPGGESVLQVCARTQDFILSLAKNTEYKNVLVASHGFAVRALLNFLYEDKSDFWQGHVPYNCAVNILKVKDGKIRLTERDKIYYDASKCVDRYKMN